MIAKKPCKVSPSTLAFSFSVSLIALLIALRLTTVARYILIGHSILLLSLLHSSSFTVPPEYLSSPSSPLPPREQRAAVTAYVPRGPPYPLLPPGQQSTTATSSAHTPPFSLDTASARVCAARVSPSLAASDGGSDRQGDSSEAVSAILSGSRDNNSRGWQWRLWRGCSGGRVGIG